MNARRMYICAEDASGGQHPHSKARAENPLVQLKKNKPGESSCEKIVLQGEKLQALDRLFGNGSIARKLRIVYRANAPVFKETFRMQLLRVLDEEDFYRYGDGGTGRREKSGSLEVPWDTYDDIPITKHHIIPRSRGGLNVEKNLLLIPRGVHDDFHHVFGIQTPLEQLAYTLLISCSTLREVFFEKIKKVLVAKNQNFYYDEGIVKDRKIIHLQQ